MNSEEYLKKDITITREERLSRDGKSLFFIPLSPKGEKRTLQCLTPDSLSLVTCHLSLVINHYFAVLKKNKKYK